MRRRYVALELPKPLPAGAIALPEIDMKALKDHDVVSGIADEAMQALDDCRSRSSEVRDELVTALADGYGMPSGCYARSVLPDWCCVGLTLGDVEERRGWAKRGKAERHVRSALQLCRGRLIEQTDEESLDGYGNALLLALEAGYYLRRSATASVQTLTTSWRTGR